MRNFLLISLLLLTLSGCSVSLFNTYKKASTPKEITKPGSCFNNIDSTYLFQTEIRFLKNYYSGLMVFKPQKDSLCRVVFMTEMGVKVFDFEISNPLQSKKNYKVYYLMEPLSKKIIQKTLVKDIGLLIQDAKDLPFKFYSNAKGQQIIKVKKWGKHYFYIAESNQKPYHQIKVKTRCFKKTDVDLYRNQEQIVDSVKIHTFGVKRSYTFRRIKQ